MRHRREQPALSYGVNRLGGRSGRLLASFDNGLLELARRARRYRTSDGSFFRWTVEGQQYSRRKRLRSCITAIEANQSKSRSFMAAAHRRWLLQITRGNGTRVTLALQEGSAFTRDAPYGTCPLLAWHREIHDQFAPLVSYGIYDCRPIDPAKPDVMSQHSYANAEDVHSPDFAKMRSVADYCEAHAERLSINVIIFDGLVWPSEHPGWWPYEGDDQHTDHVHVDFLPALSGNCRVSACRPFPRRPTSPKRKRIPLPDPGPLSEIE